MAKILYCLILLIASSNLVSCKKKCSQADISFELSGFDTIDLDQVIVKKYEKGSGFTTAITTEETHIDSSSNAYRNFSMGIRASAAYDWIVELPLAGKTYTIANIQYNNDDNPDSGGIPGGGELDVCNDGIRYSINNIMASSPTTYEMGHYPVIEIKK